MYTSLSMFPWKPALKANRGHRTTHCAEPKVDNKYLNKGNRAGQLLRQKCMHTQLSKRKPILMKKTTETYKLDSYILLHCYGLHTL